MALVELHFKSCFGKVKWIVKDIKRKYARNLKVDQMEHACMYTRVYLHSCPEMEMW